MDLLATPERVDARLKVVNTTTAPHGDGFAIDAIVGDPWMCRMPRQRPRLRCERAA
ncbi:hypothetical protein [Comamonas serinivorans]|uniref:hypothetical protein n=1 Tax=Comamonas serinivorans TaxID=1082851 RepID=UPI0012F79DA7|nr:hypothetical protein [Comamonas serinivorans]